MVKNKRDLSRLVSALSSPNPDIVRLRKIGLELIEKYSRQPLIPTKEDIKWFWDDSNYYGLHLEEFSHTFGNETRKFKRINKEACSELHQTANEYVAKHFDELNKTYPPDITGWILEWYRFFPESFYLKVDNVNQVDWNIFFTIAGRTSPFGMSPFYLVIQKLFLAQLRRFKQHLYDSLANDPVTSEKLLKGEYVPGLAQYSEIVPYTKILKEVAKRKGVKLPWLSKKAQKPQYDKRTEAILNEIHRLVTIEGLPLEEAVSRDYSHITD